MRKFTPILTSIALSALTFGSIASAPPAHATGTMAAALLGSGNVEPGLTAWPNTHQWNAMLVGPAAGLGAASVPDSLTCYVGWSSVQREAIGAGVGGGGYTCYTSMSTFTGGIIVARTGVVVVMAFTGGLVGTATCAMVPGQIPPAAVFGYSLTCAGGAVSVTQ